MSSCRCRNGSQSRRGAGFLTRAWRRVREQSSGRCAVCGGLLPRRSSAATAASARPRPSQPEPAENGLHSDYEQLVRQIRQAERAGRRHDFADLHAHILPGLDDGPASIPEVLRMLRSAYGGGIRQIVATPRMFLDPFQEGDLVRCNDEFARLSYRLQRYSESAEFSFLKQMAVYLGSENFASPEFMAAVRKRSVLTLNEGRYLSLEFPLPMSPRDFLAVVQQVVAAGFTPVIVHSEQNQAVANRPEIVKILRDQGCVIQISAASLLGLAGPAVLKTTWALLNLGAVQVVSSDGHWGNGHGSQLERSFELLSQSFNPELVYAWMSLNPSHIIADKPLPPSPPVQRR